jgi:hypothetical protein
MLPNSVNPNQLIFLLLQHYNLLLPEISFCVTGFFFDKNGDTKIQGIL